MAVLTCEIPDALSQALEARLRATGESVSQYVSRVLRRALNRPVLTLFQVSTSRALIEGVYAEAVSSSRLLSYGDFGLGTFDSLDGEMVVLDGAIYQIRSDGNARRVEEIPRGVGRHSQSNRATCCLLRTIPEPGTSGD